MLIFYHALLRLAADYAFFFRAAATLLAPLPPLRRQR